MRLQIASTSEQPVRRIARQARQIPDPIERLRFLRGLLRIVSRRRRWDVPSWPPLIMALAALAAAILIATVLMWKEF
jgi:hypothetical protein